jgi:hypothetical protein
MEEVNHPEKGSNILTSGPACPGQYTLWFALRRYRRAIKYCPSYSTAGRQTLLYRYWHTAYAVVVIPGFASDGGMFIRDSAGCENVSLDN